LGFFDLEINKENLENYFKKFIIVSYLKYNELQKLIDKSKLETYKTNSVIIEQGEKTNSVYFLVSGTVNVIDYSRVDRTIAYATLSEGEMFGEMAVIDDLPRSATVTANSNCKVICLPGETFLEIVKSNSDVCFMLLKHFSSRIRSIDQRITDVVVLSTLQRACLELVRMSKPDTYKRGNYIIEPMPTQVNLAYMIGSTRETVSRILKKLRIESVIIKTKNGYIIPNIQTLEKMYLN